MVESRPSKPLVAGSNPVSRSFGSREWVTGRVIISLLVDFGFPALRDPRYGTNPVSRSFGSREWVTGRVIISLLVDFGFPALRDPRYGTNPVSRFTQHF